EAEGVINLTAYSAGALNMSLITKDIDFGNLRVYKAIPKEFKFTLKDDNLIGEVSTPAKITYRTTGLKNGSTVIEAKVGNEEIVRVSNVEKEFTSSIILNELQANASVPGNYKGTLTVTAEYTI
ncbi:MAG: hypothetical protein ACRC5T_14130, partial [Cetobacterium sp.]